MEAHLLQENPKMDFRLPLALTLAFTLTACAGTSQTEADPMSSPDHVMEFSADSGQGYDHREARKPSSAATDSSACTAKRSKKQKGCVKAKALKAE